MQCRNSRWTRIITIADLLRLLDAQKTPQSSTPEPPVIPGGGDVPVLPSLPPVVQPDPSPESPRAIPADGTVTYGPGEVVAILPPGGGVVINIPSGRPKPVIGGHVAVAPTENLPDGMFAKVEAVTNTAQGTLVELISAPVDEVFSEINIADQSTEPPQVVDEAGRPVVASVSRANGVTAMATPASAWSCKKDGILGGVTSFWDASGDPITIRFENTRVFHHFSAGLFKSPYLLLQFSGEAVVDIGYSAKLAGFSCELTPTFRRNHRLRISLPSVGGVPVSFNLEPALKFDVNVEGRLAVSQRHFFGVTLEQDGLSAPSFRLAKSANPPTFDMAFSGSVSLFAGGDLSFMFGGGYGTANAQAGVFGAFGPELKIEQTAAKKECIEANLRFIADLGVRLELWSKRWSPTVAKLTSSPARIYGPWCPPGGVGPGSGGTTPTTPTVPGTTPGGPPPATSATLRLPRISGPSGQHFTPTGTCPIALMRPGADDLVVLEYLDGQLRGFSFGWETDESDGSFYNRTYVMGAVGPHTLQVRCTTLIPGTNTVDTVNTFATSEPVTFTVDRPTGTLNVVGRPTSGETLQVSGKCEVPTSEVTIRPYRTSPTSPWTDDSFGSSREQEVPVRPDGTFGPVAITVPELSATYKTMYVQAWCDGGWWSGAVDGYDWRVFLPTIEVGDIVAPAPI